MDGFRFLCGQILKRFISRKGEDRRERVVTLSNAGSDALERALPLWRSAQRRRAEHVGDHNWCRLVDDLSNREGGCTRADEQSRRRYGEYSLEHVC